MEELCRTGLLEAYQSYQSKPVFDECDYVVSFIGLEQSKARLYGVYRVKGRKPASEMTLPITPNGLELASSTDYYYELEEVRSFDDLRGRVVIDWGASSLSWHQWWTGKDKEVIEILPVGYVRAFPGYLDFVLSYDELVRIIGNADANREWHRMLIAIAGVYLIADMKTGKQYVGSAYGESGILGRWAVYAQTPHGGNNQLMELLAADPDYAKNFQFTVLQTLPKTLTKNEVVEYETRWKKKLGTRAFGLNSN
jgi:hypothetical protein